MTRSLSRALPFAALAVAALALAGCDTLRNAAGMGKEPPDEFAVLTKAPLVVPPEYNLMPPRPGAPPTNQVGPTDAAEAALFGQDADQTVGPITGNYSPLEKDMLNSAGAPGADPAIRQKLAADTGGMTPANDDFTRKLLFWKGPEKPVNPGRALNADAEAARIDAAKAGDASAQPQDNPPPEKKKSGGGWFDWF